MDFVDDEDLVAVAHGRDRQPFDHHLAHVVDTGVRGGVDLEHVDVAPFGDFDAGVTLAARLRRRTLHAVERARQDASRGGLAAPARPRKDERLRDAPALERVLERTRHRLLAEDVFEFLRAPLAGENLIHVGGS